VNGNESINNTAFYCVHCRLERHNAFPFDSNGNRSLIVVDVLAGDSLCPRGLAFGAIGPNGRVEPAVLPDGVDADLSGDRMLLFDAIAQLPLLQNRTVRMSAQFDDLRIMARLARSDAERQTDLAQLVERELGVPADEVGRMMLDEFGAHLELLARCYLKLIKDLHAMELLAVYSLELEVARIVADAGDCPIEMDPDVLTEIFMTSTMLGDFIEEQTGKRIDPGDARQLAGSLYGHEN